MNPFRPGSRWLLTPRCRPAWIAMIDLLSEEDWHDLDDVRQVMRDTADLAERTITNHLRSASRRGWITIRRGRIRLRNRGLIDAALDATDGSAAR